MLEIFFEISVPSSRKNSKTFKRKKSCTWFYIYLAHFFLLKWELFPFFSTLYHYFDKILKIPILASEVYFLSELTLSCVIRRCIELASQTEKHWGISERWWNEAHHMNVRSPSKVIFFTELSESFSKYINRFQRLQAIDFCLLLYLTPSLRRRIASNLSLLILLILMKGNCVQWIWVAILCVKILEWETKKKVEFTDNTFIRNVRH